jgi:hypothetical protein
MALPGSGQISFNDIRIELGISSQAPFSINTAVTDGYDPGTVDRQFATSFPNSTTPHSVSEWYSYNPKSCNNVLSVAIVTGLGDDQAVCGAPGGTFNNIYSDCSALAGGCYAFGARYACRAQAYANNYLQEAGSGINVLTDSTGLVINTWPCT